jgi:protocatechuate 3,4-dioxygenase beta subunit
MNNSIDKKRRQCVFGLIAFPVMAQANLLQPTPGAAEGPFYPTELMRYPDIDNDLVKIKGKVESAGGEVIELTGRVLDSSGKALPGARVEIWQCDVTGRYLHHGDSIQNNRDLSFQGFGMDLSDENGIYRFRTIKPVSYPGRTPHIHVKVRVNEVDRLTTQFYLANHKQNHRDWLFRNTPENLRERIMMEFEVVESLPRAVVDIVI